MNRLKFLNFFRRKRQARGVAKRPNRMRLILGGILILALAAAFFDYPKVWDNGTNWINAKKNQVSFLKRLPNIPHFYNRPFHLGLDLQGGTHLVYEADLSQIKKENLSSAMDGVRDVIERRINLYGVTEPVVQIDKVGDHHRLIVELAGIKDVKQAIEMIGLTPSLQFKEEATPEQRDAVLEQVIGKEDTDKVKDFICQDVESLSAFLLNFGADPCYMPTDLTGKYLENSVLDRDPRTYQPVVNLKFNSEGTKIFGDLTTKNVNKKIAIYLDGLPITTPVVNEPITTGGAVISGNFTVETAKQLVQRLNAGALPVPIKLINQQTIGASLGEVYLRKSLIAGLVGLLVVAIFMIYWYRFPGILSVFALLIYTAIVLAIFKLIPVTLTLAGIAGFILSVGMAVDANVLIFERIREERSWGKGLPLAIDEGFKRAWTSIRDSNISSLITCVILFWLGTSIIKGFALTLAIGILISMFSAIIITRNFLRATLGTRVEKWEKMWE